MSWEQLREIAREAAEEALAERLRPPEACPNDGEPLEPGPDDRLHCRYDGWRPGPTRRVVRC
jgi:hypothetical protein